MKHLCVFTVFLFVPHAAFASRSTADESEACRADNVDAEVLCQTSLLQTSLQITKPEPTQLDHSSKDKQAIIEDKSKVELRSPTVGKKEPNANGSLQWFSTHGLALLQHTVDRTGNAAVVTLIMLISLGVCLILVVAALTRPQQEWSMPAAESIVVDSLLKRGATPDPRLPSPADRALPPPSVPPPSGLGARKPATAPELGGGGNSDGGGLMSWFGLGSSTPAQAPLASTAQSPIYLMPELLVPEPDGAQFFIDGVVSPQAQSGFLQVWRVAGDRNQRQVLSMMLCEDARGEHASQGGITVELPSRGCQMPIAFMNTQYAFRTPAPGHGSHYSRNRHITIFSAEDMKNPWAIVERESRGVTVRRMSGEVLCLVLSGGYNTDFGNITDDGGRLIATLSNRGHSLTGLGMVRGAWTENRKVVQIAQGVDVLLIVSAIISATKLQ